MRFVAALLIVGFATSGQAEGIDFQTAARWQFSCTADEVTANHTVPKKVDFIWDRRAAAAELDGGNGVRKIMRQLNNDARYSVSFWYGPETSWIKLTDQMMIDCCYTGVLSVRHSGHYALTTHDIKYGGMKAYSAEGTCKITPVED